MHACKHTRTNASAASIQTCLNTHKHTHTNNRQDVPVQERIDHWTDAEQNLMDTLRGHIVRHILPTVCLGFGQGCLGQILQSIMHGVFISLSPSPRDLCVIARSIVAWCSDYGTEHGLASVEPVPLVEILPYLESEQSCLNPCEDDFGDTPSCDPDFAQEEPLSQLMLDVSASIEVPGISHILHNIGRDLESHLLKYKDGVFRLTKIANVLRKKENKHRLKATCFSEDAAKDELYKQHLAKFKSQCHLERWGTVVDTVMAMTMPVQAALRFGWNVSKYLKGNDEHPVLKAEEENAEDNEHATRLDLVDATIHSDFWWAYFGMLRRICSVLRKAIRWSEACPCHESLLYGEGYQNEDSDDDEEIPAHIKEGANTCPLRGRRAPELATGDLLEFVNKIHTQVAVNVLMDMPATLDDEERKIIMQDYSRAKIHITSVLSLKMAHWRESPYFCFGIAHHNQSKAFSSYQRAMGLDGGHPLITTLQSENMARDRLLFESLEGRLPLSEDISDAPTLRAFIAKLRVTPTAERAVEGTHAIVHKEVRRSPNHSSPLVSLANRFPYLQREMLDDPQKFSKFAAVFAQTTDARTAVELLGLGSHTSSRAAVGDPRSQEHWKTIYRNDAWTKYTMRAPCIATRKATTVTETLPAGRWLSD